MTTKRKRFRKKLVLYKTKVNFFLTKIAKKQIQSIFDNFFE